MTKGEFARLLSRHVLRREGTLKPYAEKLFPTSKRDRLGLFFLQDHDQHYDEDSREVPESALAQGS
jgi:hypothetical protein